MQNKNKILKEADASRRPKKQKVKLLIVEDDKFLIKAYQIKFNSAGFDVVTAMDGAAGLGIVKKELPALIILDLMLPKMNGFEFLKEIKSDEKTGNIPVIVLSNLGQQGDREKAISLGAADYLVKTDYKLEEIVEKIKKLI